MTSIKKTWIEKLTDKEGFPKVFEIGEAIPVFQSLAQDGG